ncbi:hypothetical protein Bca4012_048582 [Brassica carinata]|uniref:Zinc finger GRF-type domain-containing protein n=1 Tax=Brassica carinata TaxID=52824 RepID=A0A8X7UIR8_BRACI|nr:hypothetical protein Bca52824_051527 [Brassica carinata]
MAATCSEFSDANSSRFSEGHKNGGPLCHCGRLTSITKSWSDDNPGRNYFRCVVHTFVAWADSEPPTLWQKISLLEARDIKPANAKLIRDLNCLHEAHVREMENAPTIAANKTLQDNLMKSEAREKMLRHCLHILWAGFIIATAILASCCVT